MEEESRKYFSKSLDRNSNFDDVDPLCLYCPQLPADMSEDDFTALLSGNGRRTITNIRLIKKPPYIYCYGFAYFATNKDASSALYELNGRPPFNLIIFAKKKTHNKTPSSSEHLSSFKERGRGMHISTNEPKDNVNINKENADFVSKGRGQRLSLEGPIPQVNAEDVGFISRGRGQRIFLEGPVSQMKIIAGNAGRKVTVDSSPEKPDSDLDSLTRVSNPFYFCFLCGQKGTYSCKQCRKPYCSEKCQITDTTNHKEICKRAKCLAESLISLYKNSHVSDSGAGSNSDPSDYDSSFEVKSVNLIPKTIGKLVLSPAEIELVDIISIENPSKFWVRLKKYSSDFYRMEDKLTSLQKDLKHFHNQCCVSPQLICCTLYNTKMCRAKVLKVKSQNEILVDLLDYGKIVTVQKSSLCNLPAEFRNLLAQAVLCRLVSDDSEIIQWNEEDTLSFQLHTSSKTYKIRTFNCSNDVYDVSLINEEGISLYSILMEVKKAVPLSIKVPTSSLFPEIDGKPPSIWTKLRPNTKMFLIRSIINGNFIWAYLISGKSDLKELEELENKMKNYSGEDVSLTAEEEDFVAGFSNEYKQYFRCRIIKRMRKSFLVHFIDYGNEEEITNISSLTEELFQKCCYLVKCEKPSDLSIVEFEKFLGDSGAEVTVLKVEKNLAKLSFHYNKKYSVICYPCYLDYVLENETSDIQTSPILSKESPISELTKIPQNVNNYEVISEKNISKITLPSPDATPISKSRKSSENFKDYKVIAEKITAPKVLLLSTNYCVKILFIKTVSELYVQLIEHELEMQKMEEDINKFCISEKRNYIPKIGEIVSCKFQGSWFRGKVLEKHDNVFRILFVDYGNEDFVSQNDIKILPDKFIMPQFSVCVSLHQIKHQDVSENLLEKLLSEKWDMKVINLNKIPVDVILSQKNISIKEMIEKQNNYKANLEVAKTEVDTNIKDKSFLIYKKLSEGGISTVKICYMDDKLVYLHKVDDLQIVEDLLLQLNTSAVLQPAVNPILNKVYCGLCSDGCWYRVSVEEITSSNTYRVYFLDFGNYETLPIKNLKELPSDLFSVPVCCIPVIVEKREELTLNFEDQYKIQVTGKQENWQKVKFIDFRKDDPQNANKDNIEKYENEVKQREIVELPHISSLKKQKLQDGVNEVKFCHLEGDIMYCQLSADNDTVLSMFKELQKCGREGETPASVSVGNVVCAQSSDTLWYRACILCDKKAPSYKVLFFDYGNAESITGDCIKIMPNELLNFPVFAIPMKIENADNITDMTIYTKPMFVKKIKVINGDTYIVKLQLEEEIIYPKISTLKRLTLPEDDISNVSVCHADGSLYYIQPTSNIEDFTKLTNKLLEANTFCNVSHTPEEGDIICAKFIDDLWYRCVVKKIHSDKVEVNFIDFGNSNLVSRDNLKILPSELCSYAIASIPVKFKNQEIVQSKLLENAFTFNVKVCNIQDNIHIVDIISEAHTNNISQTKPVEDIVYIPTFFSSFTKSSLALKEFSKVVFKMKVNDFYVSVKLDDCDKLEKLNSLLQESETDVISHLPSINEVLLAKKDNLWYRCTLTQFVEENLFKVYFVDLGITEDIQKCALRNLPDNCKTYPLFAIKIVTESDQPIIFDRCYNIYVLNKNCDDMYNAHVFHQYKYSSLSRKELIPLKESDVIFIHKEGEKMFLQRVDDIEILTEMQKMLDNLSLNQHMPYKPEVGELVCAMSQLDGSWYRGCIEEILLNNDFKVFFIDYGNYENVQGKDLQPLPSGLSNFPSLSIPVIFKNNEVIERIEFQKIYNIVAESEPSNGVQVITLVENDEVVACSNHKSSSENLKDCGAVKKFMFESCKFIPFDSGEQDIVIYSVDDEGYMFCAPYNPESIQANLELSALLTQYCCNNNGISFDDCQPEINELVLALYSADNNWYRAVILENLHPKYLVNFIDFGNTEYLNVESLRKMEKKFMELEVQAHLCSITGFTYPDKSLSKVCDELKKFDMFTHQKPIKANVKVKGGEIVLNVPIITSHLMQKNLVSAVVEE